jgi:hypothetical protein
LPTDTAVFRSSALIFAANAVDGLVGSGYWLLASRSMPVDVVGRSTAVLSLMTGVSGLAAGGAELTLIERLPPLRDRTGWLRVLAITTGAALTATALVAGAAVVVLPGRFAAFALLTGPVPLVLLLTGSLAWTAGKAVDRTRAAQAAAGTMLLRGGLR